MRWVRRKNLFDGLIRAGMTRHKVVASKLTVIAAMTCVLAIVASPALSRDFLADQSDEIGFLRIGMEEARNRLSAARYTFEFDYTKSLPPGVPATSKTGLRSIGTVTVARQGERLFASRTGKMTTGTNDIDSGFRMVVNEGYTAFWDTPMGSANQYQHESPGADPRGVKSLMQTLLSADPLGYAFGFGRGLETLRPLEAPPNADLRVSKVNQPGGGAFQIEILYRSSPVPRSTTYIVSPSHGFLILEFHNRYGPSFEHDIRITPRRLSDDVWLPGAVDDVCITQAGRATTTVSLRDVEITPKFDADFFTIKSLNLRDELPVSRTLSNGSHVSCVYTQGQIIPRDVLQELRGARRRIETLTSLRDHLLEGKRLPYVVIFGLLFGCILVWLSWHLYRAEPKRKEIQFNRE